MMERLFVGTLAWVRYPVEGTMFCEDVALKICRFGACREQTVRVRTFVGSAQFNAHCSVLPNVVQNVRNICRIGWPKLRPLLRGGQ